MMEENRSQHHCEKASPRSPDASSVPPTVKAMAVLSIIPLEPADFLPIVKYGDKCIYIHPKCKCGSGWNKRNHPYTHLNRKIPPARYPVMFTPALSPIPTMSATPLFQAPQFLITPIGCPGEWLIFQKVCSSVEALYQ